jgi:hypothetical protein
MAVRECCGGQGFAAANRIGMYKSDAEIDLTYEGDNTILMQVSAIAPQIATRLIGLGRRSCAVGGILWVVYW